MSYGFLFLRDGRWVHVGVEATKHAVSARRAGPSARSQLPVDVTTAMFASMSFSLSTIYTEEKQNSIGQGNHCREVIVSHNRLDFRFFK